MDIILVLIVPLAIVALFLFVPVAIFYLTNIEKKYVRFARIHKLDDVKKYKYDLREKLKVARAGTFFSVPIFFALCLYFYIDTLEVPFLLMGLFYLVLFVHDGFSICHRLYKDYKGYRYMSRILWSLNILLSIMIAAIGFNITLIIICSGLWCLWWKTTERALLYSLK